MGNLCNCVCDLDLCGNAGAGPAEEEEEDDDEVRSMMGLVTITEEEGLFLRGGGDSKPLISPLAPMTRVGLTATCVDDGVGPRIG